MDYTQQGFNEFLTRGEIPNSSQELDPLQAEQYNQEISASKIQGGSMQTTNGLTKLDLETGSFQVNDGAVQVVRLGVQEDGSIGLVIKNREGNELLRFVGDTNILRSPDGNMELNFDNNNLVIKEEGGLPRLILGKK